jgi:hypothetical protein
MSTSLIADNWSLQDIGELLQNGLDQRDTHSITISKTARHAYAPLPKSAVAIEALFDLITDIVLRDQLLVEKKFTSSWADFDVGLHQLVKEDVIRPFEFLAQAKTLEDPRNEFVRRLCMTRSLREAHKKNVALWDRSEEINDPMLSQTLWGGAGMLARAFIGEKGYTPHPLRRRLFQQANLVLPHEDASDQLIATIQEKRASLSKSKFGRDKLYSLRLNVPPMPILVMREASDATQLLPIALQMRDRYQDLRDWLREYQRTFEEEKFSKRFSFEKSLRSVSAYIDSLSGSIDPNAATYTAGLSILKVAFKGRPIEVLKNQFGVRASANRLILAGSGLKELRRLLGFFGHQRSGIGLRVVEHFRSHD